MLILILKINSEKNEIIIEVSEGNIDTSVLKLSVDKFVEIRGKASLIDMNDLTYTIVQS